ncbi:MAG: DNA topoisomerase VI subunit B [Candidatus Hydrothermarchaeota archaeon]
MEGTIAYELAKKQKEISVSEFFSKNRAMLGFDNPQKALFISVKEAVDNSLDACEEAKILPDIIVKVSEVKNGLYSVCVEDNGPGILPEQIPLIFGKLLYGSRFHTRKQTRGQQGIGISGAVLYSNLTTGHGAIVESSIGKGKPTYKFEVSVDLHKNQPRFKKLNESFNSRAHGTRIEILVKGAYRRGERSIDSYIEQTVTANPWLTLTYINPEGKKVVYQRSSNQLPPEPKEIPIHPHGIDVGELMLLLRLSSHKKLRSFLIETFSRISTTSVEKIGAISGVNLSKKPSKIDLEEAKRLVSAFKKIKFIRPPTDCLSPIGPDLIEKGILRVHDVDFVAKSIREPTVYSGNPFLIECGLGYGGELPRENRVKILRFANRVPLLYQEGADVITHTIEKIDWRKYGLNQPGGKGIPHGPALIMVHVASVYVPFTSEAKEAIGNITEIAKEIRLGLQECGRQLRIYLSKKRREEKLKERADWVREYVPLILQKAAEITGEEAPDPTPIIHRILGRPLE